MAKFGKKIPVRNLCNGFLSRQMVLAKKLEYNSLSNTFRNHSSDHLPIKPMAAGSPQEDSSSGAS